MGPHALDDPSMAAITLATQCLGPNVYKEWWQRILNLSVQHSKVWFMSVICSLGSAKAIFAGILPVDGSDDDEGSEWIDDGGFGRIDRGFGFGGGDNEKGWSYIRDGWNSEEWGWGEAGDSVFNSVYEVACWISLSHCLHYAFKKVVHLIQNGMGNSSGEEATSFALCSSAFLQKDLVIPPMVSDDLLKHDRVSK
eukprot:Gb_25103 [translate_table: standard]